MLVAGAAGGVGEAIVRALLSRTDVRVIATSREPQRLARLRSRLEGLDVARLLQIVGNAGDDDGAAAIAQQIRREAGDLAFAIPSLGGWWEGGPLLGVDAATWDAVMEEMLTTHVAFARVFIPELLRAGGGTYLAIGGGAALMPIRNASIVSIAGAAQLMLTRALALELSNAPVQILELVVNAPVLTRDIAAPPGSRPIAADDVGTVVAELVCGEPPSWPRMRVRGPVAIMDP